MKNGEEIKLEGMVNFRELGGYAGAGGRKVKEGVFYRCGALTTLTESDMEYINSLGIKHLFDFRSKSEADAKPEPHFGEYHRISPMVYEDGSEVDFSPDGMGRLMAMLKGSERGFVQLYLNMIARNDAFAAMFDAITKHEVPIIFHCTGGKDRTGMAAALILLALGVDGETVMSDYLLTNVYRKQIMEDCIKAHPEEDPDKICFREGVTEAHMRESLAFMLEKYGSYDECLKQEYGLDLEALRDHYLE